MAGETGIPTTGSGTGGSSVVPPGILAGGTGAAAAASANGGGSAALVLAETPEETAEDSEGRDTRLDRLAMQLDVMVRVQSMRVQDLLSLENGTVVETIHEHSQDLPVRCGGALLAWAEFEVVDQKLAVRITRLA